MSAQHPAPTTNPNAAPPDSLLYKLLAAVAEEARLRALAVTAPSENKRKGLFAGFAQTKRTRTRLEKEVMTALLAGDTDGILAQEPRKREGEKSSDS